jgi:hypothetical protein
MKDREEKEEKKMRKKNEEEKWGREMNVCRRVSMKSGFGQEGRKYERMRGREGENEREHLSASGRSSSHDRSPATVMKSNERSFDTVSMKVVICFICTMRWVEPL